MRRILILLAALTAVLKLASCYGPCLNFSPTKLNFDVNGGNGVINASGRWSIRSIVIDDTVYHDSYFPYICDETGEENEGTWFCMTIEGEAWDARRLLFSVKPNSTGKSRKLQLNINGLNCPAPILTITQSAK